MHIKWGIDYYYQLSLACFNTIRTDFFCKYFITLRFVNRFLFILNRSLSQCKPSVLSGVKVELAELILKTCQLYIVLILSCKV